jgi:hypothetical protein
MKKTILRTILICCCFFAESLMIPKIFQVHNSFAASVIAGFCAFVLYVFFILWVDVGAMDE